MTLDVVLVLAAVTYGSRAAALVLLPEPSPAIAAFLGRMPAPLFAGLAALALVRPEGGVADPVPLAAIGGAVLAARTRSLGLILAGGLLAAGVAVRLV